MWHTRPAIDKSRDTSDWDHAFKRAEFVANCQYMTHVLIHGPEGAGKKTMCNMMLETIYGVEGSCQVLETRTMTMKKKQKQIPVNCMVSKHSMTFSPSKARTKDHQLIRSVIDNYGQTGQQKFASSWAKFPTLVLLEADRMTPRAQMALRGQMDKTLFRIILVVENLSHVIPAVRSRCMRIRMPAPLFTDVEHVLLRVAKRERVPLSPDIAARIAVAGKRNLLHSIMLFQKLVFANRGRVPADCDFFQEARPDWDYWSEALAKRLCSDPPSLLSLNQAVEVCFQLISAGLTLGKICKSLLGHLHLRVDDAARHLSLKRLALHDVRMTAEQHPRIALKLAHFRAWIASWLVDRLDVVF